MDGILYIAVLVAGVALAGIRSRRVAASPGVVMTLAIIAGSAWYMFG